MPVFRVFFCHEQLIRDLNESWLIMFVGLFVRWNGLRQLEVPTLGANLLRNTSEYRLADVFFGGGLLAFILPFRRYWVPRCNHRIQLLLLVAEVLLLLRIVEFNDNVVWQPFLGLYRDMFETLGCGDFWIYRAFPGMAKWLVDGRAFESFQLLVSFAFFMAGINCVAEEWMTTVNLLLLGCEPQHPRQAWRRHYRDLQRQGFRFSRRGEPPNHLMYGRLCSACIHEAAMAAEPEQQQQPPATNEPEINSEMQAQEIPLTNQ